MEIKEGIVFLDESEVDATGYNSQFPLDVVPDMISQLGKDFSGSTHPAQAGPFHCMRGLALEYQARLTRRHTLLNELAVYFTEKASLEIDEGLSAILSEGYKD
jgi:hypothetical protein